MSGTVVPPPAPIPPPSDAGDQSDSDLMKRKAKKDDEDEDTTLAAHIPAWVVYAAKYVGGPLMFLAAILAAILGFKVLRRHRRRSAASVSARFVGAWHELVDHARDLGQPVPLGPTVTRREQSGSIGSQSAPTLARRADSFVFGPAVPEAAAAETYWESVESERRAMSSSVGRRRRWLAAISVASLRRGKMTPSAASEPASPPAPSAELQSPRPRRVRLPNVPALPRLPRRPRGGKRRSS
jgi:hypothetical protein